MLTEQITIINKLGLHARAAAKLVSTASAYASRVRIGREGQMVDGKSIMSVMMLAASQGTELILEIPLSSAALRILSFAFDFSVC